jgi:hypothetical protein
MSSASVTSSSGDGANPSPPAECRKSGSFYRGSARRSPCALYVVLADDDAVEIIYLEIDDER